MSQGTEYVRWFGELGIDDVAVVGGKNASLGELYRELTGRGVNVPNGFALTAAAYRDTLTEAGAWVRWRRRWPVWTSRMSPNSPSVAVAPVRSCTGPLLPDAVRDQVVAAYRTLEDQYGHELSVAIRSSATAEDLPTASFAGQHESYLNVHGAERVLEACRRCFASLFTDRAISYRVDQGFDHLSIALSVGVMKMVRSDLASSGVLFTLDTESGFRDVVFITGAYGLGENVVQGVVDPDEFYVHKPTYEAGFRAVLRRKLGRKQVRMVYAQSRGGQTTTNVPTPEEDRQRFCLTDDEVLTLAGYGIEVEKHYGEHAGHPMPMDIEWAKDGVDGQLYLLQARPETVASQHETTIIREYRVRPETPPLVEGRSVGSSVAVGSVRVVKTTEELARFRPGQVLVADTTTPDWEPVMKTAAAIVTNRGGRTCHAAIVARELGIAAVVGAEGATETLVDGSLVTVSCAPRRRRLRLSRRSALRGRRHRLRGGGRDQHGHHGQHRQPRSRLSDGVAPGRRCRPRPHGVHHLGIDQGTSDGSPQPGSRRRSRGAEAHPGDDRRLSRTALGTSWNVSPRGSAPSPPPSIRDR